MYLSFILANTLVESVLLQVEERLCSIWLNLMRIAFISSKTLQTNLRSIKDDMESLSKGN